MKRQDKTLQNTADHFLDQADYCITHGKLDLAQTYLSNAKHWISFLSFNKFLEANVTDTIQTQLPIQEN